ncbi:cytochrome P450 [Chitinophaga solisilvae]|uniref:cytochrome P450 n=1 Tax=Chitinophaga solisilvae TaxID=1233460 RepID=UPI001920F66F|nr:cytochrome P450 [Chitinophaga solisilvae]
MRINLFSPEYQEDPYYFYQVMHRHQPLFFHEPTGSYVLSRHEDIVKAFKDPAFSSRNYAWQMEPLHGKTIIQMDGREHSASRNVVVPAFRGKELMENTLPVMRSYAAALLSGFNGREVVELRDEFTNIFPIKVIVGLLGLPEEDLLLFHRWYNILQRQFTNLSNDDAVLQEALTARDEFRAYLDAVLAERMAKPGHDLLSVLCTAEVDGVRMDSTQIKGFCGLLLQAGAETTDKALANMVRNLLLHPDQFERLRKDRSLLDRAIIESLRFSPPTHMLLRITNEKVQVSGGEIPAEATVICLIGAANRDGKVFDRPDEFNIFREELDPRTAFTGASNIATFGFGRHYCVGVQLAKMEMQVAMEYLLDYMEEMSFAEPEIPKETGVFTRYPESLRIRFKPRT